MGIITKNLRVWLFILGSLFTPFSISQTLTLGPAFYEGGFYLVQYNVNDSTFDPYEVLWNFNYRLDPPEREAIVDLRLDVLPDGTVENVEVLGGFYDQEFLDKVLGQANQLQFQPAHAGETAIAWPRMDLRIILRGMFLPGLRQEFRPELRKVIGLIKNKEFEEAENAIQTLLESRAKYLFEYALLQDQLASVYLATDRPRLALLASRNATQESKAVVDLLYTESRIRRESSRYPDEYLSPDQYLGALHKRFMAAALLTQTGEVLKLFDEIESRASLAGREELTSELKPIADKVKALLDGGEPISSVIELINGKWIFRLSSRHTFGATGLEGKIDFIDFNCEGLRKRRIIFRNDTEWKVPQSWGDCTMEFLGESGSRFYLIEYLQ